MSAFIEAKIDFARRDLIMYDVGAKLAWHGVIVYTKLKS